jgi:hypothetical protein
MLCVMSIRPSPRVALWMVIAGAVLLPGAALYLAITGGDPVSPLFRRVLTMQIMAALLLWFIAAWAARRLTVGRLPKPQLNSTGILWGGSRVALLIATVLLMLGWLTSLALGLAVQVAFARAVVLLFVVTALTGLAGGAVINSVLVARHWRAHTPE